MIHICISALALHPGQSGGIETFLVSLVKALRGSDRVNRYTLIARSENHHLFAPLDGENFQVLVVRGKHGHLRGYLKGLLDRSRRSSLLRGITATVAPGSGLDKLAKRLGPDVLHIPESVLLPGQEPPIPCVINIHDLQHEHFPYYFSGIELRQRRRRTRFCAQVAGAIVVASQYVKEDLIRTYNCQPERIHVVPLPPPEIFRTSVSPERCKELRTKYNLPERYAFYPADLRPAKNHVRLLYALSLLKRSHQSDLALVLCGAKKDTYGVLKQTILKLGLQRDVFYLGYVPFEDLPGLYAGARMTVVPTLFEAASFPVEEAFAVGSPVACSNVSSLPEFVRDAAIVFDPLDPSEIAMAMYRIDSSPQLRQQLVMRGHQIVNSYTWHNTADRYRKIYEMIAGRDGADGTS
jgi:glycosyltransferase involved in cell wall biosynthesis